MKSDNGVTREDLRAAIEAVSQLNDKLEAVISASAEVRAGALSRAFVPTRFLGLRAVLARYDDINATTLDAWLKRGEFPPPSLVVSGKRYWEEKDLEAFERASVGGEKVRNSGMFEPGTNRHRRNER